MMLCNRGDCPGGRIDETGFCETCHRRPQARQTPATATGEPAPAVTARSALSGQSGRASEPEPELLDDVRVPTGQRICQLCLNEVGRNETGHSGRDRGNCPKCGAPFDFQPRLRPGDIVDGRYRVRGVLGRGGFGWTYLAHDEQLEQPVVIKGVISDQVAATLEREREHLAVLKHPNIVRILGYVSAGHYLVLEYAGNKPISPVPLTEPLEPMLTAGLDILAALDYLHGKGFLHCDVKPDNIVRGRDGVRLIDFGAVRRIDDPSPVAMLTEAYSPPSGDRERSQPGPGFDLYCTAMTLRYLCRPYLDHRPNRAGTQALRLLLDRAMHSDHRRRFFSAGQFAEQLRGVIRQVAGARAGPHRSVLFGLAAHALDGGLGAVVPVDRWATASVAGPGVLRMADPPFGPPGRAQVAEALPAVLPDPWDTPAARAARSRDAADGHAGPAGWQRTWYEGKDLLEKGDAAGARRAFVTVREWVPGELVPLLALGLCAELRDDIPAATAFYQRTSETDESVIAAHFGLARVLLADGRRADAVDALEKVPEQSRFWLNARMAVIRSLAMVVRTGDGELPPSPEDVARARDLREDLDLDERSRALLEMEFCAAEAACQGLAGALTGEARRRQEEALRALARFARSPREHTALIDLANAVRPVTIWSW